MLLIYEDGATYGLLIFCDYNKKQHLSWKQNPEKKLTMRDKKRRRSASGGVNQIWILKNSKELIEYTQSRSLSFCNSIKTFDFSPLYTTMQH